MHSSVVQASASYGDEDGASFGTFDAVVATAYDALLVDVWPRFEESDAWHRAQARVATRTSVASADDEDDTDAFEAAAKAAEAAEAALQAEERIPLFDRDRALCLMEHRHPLRRAAHRLVRSALFDKVPRPASFLHLPLRTLCHLQLPLTYAPSLRRRCSS